MIKLLELPKQTPAEEIDEEFLEVFVEAVKEVLGEMTTHLEKWQKDATATQSLETLRRCFHTLKGSGRLVGATVIGELGGQFEDLLDDIIDGTLLRNAILFSILEKVQELLPRMVEQFKHNEPPSYEVVLLISQAHWLVETKGQRLDEVYFFR